VGIEYTRWTAGTRWVSDDGGDRKAFLFVDGAEQGTLVLRDSSGSEAVRLYVDDGTDHGGIAVSDDGGDRKSWWPTGTSGSCKPRPRTTPIRPIPTASSSI